MVRTLTAKRARTILWGKLGWHPAVNAWIAFADGAGMPDTIEVLRDGKQSATYRLVGAGPNGESVIAQRVQAAWVQPSRGLARRCASIALPWWTAGWTTRSGVSRRP